MSKQLTSIDVDELNIIDLYKHYAALESTQPLVTSDSKDLLEAEMENVLDKRSEKVDRIYYAISANEDALDRIKKETELVQRAKVHHESKIKSLKGLLSFLRRTLVTKSNKLIGKNYQFTLTKKKTLSVEITSQIEDWTEEERQKFCIEQEINRTTVTVLRSLSGEELDRGTSISKPKKTILPNLDALRQAHQSSQQLPHGVKVIQEYSIRSSRVFKKSGKLESSVEMEASDIAGELLP